MLCVPPVLWCVCVLYYGVCVLYYGVCVSCTNSVGSGTNLLSRQNLTVGLYMFIFGSATEQSFSQGGKSKQNTVYKKRNLLVREPTLGWMKIVHNFLHS